MPARENDRSPKDGRATIVALARRTILFGVLAGALAALYTLTLDNEYSAESGLLLAPPPLSEAVRRTQQGAADNPAAQLGFLMGRSLSVPGYEILLRNGETVQRLRDKLDALYAERGDNTEARLEDVRESMAMRTTILKQTANDVEYLPLMTLAYRANDPEIAAAMANEWSTLAVALSKEVGTKGKTGSLEFLQARFEDVNAELQENEQAIQEHETKWDIESLLLRLQMKQKLVTEYELDQVRLNTDIESRQAELTEVEKDLESTSEKTTLRKAPSDEAYWLMEAARKGSPDSSDVLETEVVNDLYVTLRETKSTLQSAVSGLIKKREAAAGALAELKPEVDELQRDLAEQKRVRTQLTRRAEILQAQYTRIAENLEAARVAEAEMEPDLKIAFQAVPPETKVGPHRSVTVLVAAFLGALVVPVHFFVIRSLRRFAKHLDTGLSQHVPPAPR